MGAKKRPVLKLDLIVEHLQTPNKALMKAAKKVVKDIDSHFKKDKWDLCYSQLIADIYYQANKHHLENYLLKSLMNKNYCLMSSDNGLVIRKVKKKKK